MTRGGLRQWSTVGVVLTVLSASGGCARNEEIAVEGQAAPTSVADLRCDPRFGKQVMDALVVLEGPGAATVAAAVEESVRAIEGRQVPSPPSDAQMRSASPQQIGFRLTEVPGDDRGGRDEVIVTHHGPDHLEASYHVLQTDQGGWVVDHWELCPAADRAREWVNR